MTFVWIELVMVALESIKNVFICILKLLLKFVFKKAFICLVHELKKTKNV